MEILQTLWTALTTSNEELTNLIIAPLSLIEMSVVMLLFTTILNINATRKRKLIYVLSCFTWSIISRILFPANWLSLINIVTFIAIAMLVLKLSFFKTIVAEVISFIVFAIFEPISLNLITSILNIAYLDIQTIPIYRLIFLSCTYLSIYLLYRLLRYLNLNITVLDSINVKTRNVLILNCVIGIIAIFMQRCLSNYYSDNIPVLITTLSTITLLIYFFISMYSLIRTTKLELTEQSLEEAKLYNKSLKILHDNVRAFKHDFSNIVQAIGGYIGTNDMKGLETYYAQLLGDCQKVNNLYTLSPDVINNPAIYSLLTSKYHTADELGIQIHLEVFLNLNELSMKIYEFTRILGILMDNAIEASYECDEKLITVEIRNDFHKNRQLLIIENTYKEKDINIDRIFEKGYSSKPNNTGLGLWEVRQILKRNRNLNLYTTKNNNLFKQQLEIYDK